MSAESSGSMGEEAEPQLITPVAASGERQLTEERTDRHLRCWSPVDIPPPGYETGKHFHLIG